MYIQEMLSYFCFEFWCEGKKMLKLLTGKRILEKETEEGSLYFVLRSDAFHKYVGLWVI